ncbi:hypothetical protein SeLEV6574_g03321 [Synchytrium endobioticum]|uniref:UspA domain-containing protein n=1 Tax=Synchytrium endobioticum TaxID=286115 RepID=A0A507D4M2_9FUNG|nr:hypothetical protein SeLEV6574_g03321 [Synchytrium endobioticum]
MDSRRFPEKWRKASQKHVANVTLSEIDLQRNKQPNVNSPGLFPFAKKDNLVANIPLTGIMAQRTIVLGIPTSTIEGFKSDPAFHWCLRNYLRNGDTLLIQHASKSLPGSTTSKGGISEGVPPPVLLEMQAHIENAAKGMLGSSGLSDVGVFVSITHGDPRDVLLGVAEDKRPCTVVVGSRGIGAVRRALMGSVSSALANNCTQTVIIVKE